MKFEWKNRINVLIELECSEIVETISMWSRSWLTISRCFLQKSFASWLIDFPLKQMLLLGICKVLNVQAAISWPSFVCTAPPPQDFKAKCLNFTALQSQKIFRSARETKHFFLLVKTTPIKQKIIHKNIYKLRRFLFVLFFFWGVFVKDKTILIIWTHRIPVHIWLEARFFGSFRLWFSSFLYFWHQVEFDGINFLFINI